MSVEAELARFAPDKDTLLTIGVFDGVHLGHKRLIAELVAQAGERDMRSGVVTFRRHPQEVLRPGAKIPFLTDLEERSRLLRNEGVEMVIPLSFTEEKSQLGAREFVGLLKRHLRMQGLVIGPDFALGRNREGGAEALRDLGQEMGFSLTVVSAKEVNGDVVSSTAVRQALAGGDVARVRKLLGHDFGLHGRVIAGAGRGVSLGFPTANLDFSLEQALPADGVYATWTYINGQAHEAMANVGQNPTFGDNQRAVEVFVVDYQGDLYGCDLKVDFVARLREEKKFDSVAELQKQMAEDVKKGKAILEAEVKN
jgi:riboflavin kinase/FMN adenylyltransferase